MDGKKKEKSEAESPEKKSNKFYNGEDVPHIEKFLKKIGNGSSSTLYEGTWLVELEEMTSASGEDVLRKTFQIPPT